MEADCLLTLLTKKKGRIGAIAKGVRKPISRLRGGVQPFTYNEMLLYEGRSMDIITQSDCLETFTPFHENITAAAAAAYWSEMIYSLTPEKEGDLGLFQLALAGFHVLCLEPTEITLRSLEAKLLFHLGYNPCLDKCVYCGNTGTKGLPLTFSVDSGGIICPACAVKGGTFKLKKFNHEALRLWLQMLRMDISKINRLKASPQALEILEGILEEFFLSIIDYPFKSRSIVKALMDNTGHSGL